MNKTLKLTKDWKRILRKLHWEDRYLPMFKQFSRKFKIYDIVSFVARMNFEEREWRGIQYLFIKGNTMISPPPCTCGKEIRSQRKRIKPDEEYHIAEFKVKDQGAMTIERRRSNEVLRRDYKMVEKDGKRISIFLREIDITEEVFGKGYQ